jgi:hypothetical protein
MIKEAYDFYFPFAGGRKNQLECVFKVLQENLQFKKLEVIETGASQNFGDGCFGIFFGKLAILSGGIFHSVDIDPWKAHCHRQESKQDHGWHALQHGLNPHCARDFLKLILR